MAQQQPHQLRAGVAGGAEHADLCLGLSPAWSILCTVEHVDRTANTAENFRGEAPRTPGPAARRRSRARRCLGTAAAEQALRRDHRHGRPYRRAAPDRQCCRDKRINKPARHPLTVLATPQWEPHAPDRNRPHPAARHAAGPPGGTAAVRAGDGFRRPHPGGRAVARGPVGPVGGADRRHCHPVQRGPVPEGDDRLFHRHARRRRVCRQPWRRSSRTRASRRCWRFGAGGGAAGAAGLDQVQLQRGAVHRHHRGSGAHHHPFDADRIGFLPAHRGGARRPHGSAGFVDRVPGAGACAGDRSPPPACSIWWRRP